MVTFSTNHLFHFFFFFFFFLVLLPNAIHSSKPFISSDCDQYFTHNKILQNKIENALLDMIAQSSVQGYAIYTHATQGSNTIYGVTRCRPDRSIEACSACITTAARTIRSFCPDSAETRMWYGDCFIHYDTANFIGTLDRQFAGVLDSDNDAENPIAFLQAVGDLMGEVMAQTAEGYRKFGYGEKYVNEELKVYGMAQCTRDLGETACRECLLEAAEFMSDYCGDGDGCRFIGSSCVMRYDVYNFSSIDDVDDEFDDAVASAPSPV